MTPSMRSAPLAAAFLVLCVALPRVQAQETDEARALVVAQRAAENFRTENYEHAEVLLREAITLHETPALHYNLARTLVHLERLSDAHDEYTLYLELDPETVRRTLIEAEIAELEAAMARADEEALAAARAEEAAGQAAAARAAEAQAIQRTVRTTAAPWWLAGAGAVVALGGIPFVVLSDRAVARSRGATSQRDAGPPADQAKRNIITADVLFVLGAAMTGVGLIWGFVQRGRNEPSVSIRAQGAGFSVEGRF